MADDELSIKIELAVHKAFEKNIPKIVDECSRRDEIVRGKCNAYNLFRRDTDVDEYRKMLQNFDKTRKKELLIFGISITAVNAVIMVYLRKFIG
ncbi:MAG: hypothetical protein Q8P20_01000 [bacterium]|nr:hypothetical protein [bacterium]MDZ4228046.1 hypothetical protein [Candidatus Levybacteria bacterium]